jgi:DTW domain-containing protein YfiP
LPSPLRCDRCALQRTVCLCADIAPVSTDTEFLIVRHVVERARPSNSGRVAALALTRCQLLEQGVHNAPLDEAPLRRPGLALLFPGGRLLQPADAGQLRAIVVLDGSWAQARRMRQRIPALRALPTVSLPAPPARDRLRREHLAEGMSTLEAIAETVALLDGPGPAEQLRALHARFVERSLITSRGYRQQGT